MLFLGQELLSNLISLPTIGGMKMNRVGNSFLPGVFNILLMSRKQKRKGQWTCRYKSSLFRSEEGGLRVRTSVLPAPALKARNRESFYLSLLFIWQEDIKCEAFSCLSDVSITDTNMFFFPVFS